ncbi:hypothetical protein G6F24_017939 [Rhizopus arrhizus]|nr:hypothetical protein G6F24_017939 [Rhizopus arrhizus]
MRVISRLSNVVPSQLHHRRLPGVGDPDRGAGDIACAGCGQRPLRAPPRGTQQADQGLPAGRQDRDLRDRRAVHRRHSGRR